MALSSEEALGLRLGDSEAVEARKQQPGGRHLEGEAQSGGVDGVKG